MIEIHDAHWLVSDDAAILLDECQNQVESRREPIAIIKSLRKSLPANRASLILDQAQLRIRAKRKFALADKMFFTRPALEMATDETIANFKAQRLSSLNSVADICCSIGGDLIGLAQRSPRAQTSGLDLNDVAVLFANKNLEAHGISGEANVGDFNDFSIGDFDAIHIDPDRRQHGRSTFGDKFEPSLDEIFARLGSKPDAAIKVAPATRNHDYFPEQVERQWIGHSRECKQQVIWTGDLAIHKGCRVATVISDTTVEEFVRPAESADSCRVSLSRQLKDHIFETQNTVLAAGLNIAYAEEHRLERIDDQVAYLTSDDPIESNLVACFKVIDVVPANIKKITSAVLMHQCGNLEIKNRGVEDKLVEQVRRIRPVAGGQQATIVLSPIQGKPSAIIARRQK